MSIIIAAGSLLLAGLAAQAGVEITIGHNGNDEAAPEFRFKTIPAASATDAATTATFSIVEGTLDENSGGLEKLHDGKLPGEEDQPAENFFFQAGTSGGRLQVDLGSVIRIKQVNTYSWHPSTRGPQIYKLYGSDGGSKDFNASPKSGTNPESCGWKPIAGVNTKTPNQANEGGQYGVSISDPDGAIGRYRYLLFDMATTENDDDWGNTFYSEIDVVDADAPVIAQPAAESPAPAAPYVFKTDDGKCEITIQTKDAPQLRDWAESKLAPVLAEWYPKIVAMLPGDGYTAPAHFSITLKPMDGVAFTSGRSVTANSKWLAGEIGKEAVGSLVQEAVHVVQQFGDGGGRNPGWLVEGSADYIRWFKYEPQSHGADIVWMRHLRNFTPHYNDSYRVTANFLNWVTEKYDTNIVRQLNAAMRNGKYDGDLWKQHTGRTASQLGEEWAKDIETQLATGNDSDGPN
jgi:hypothetical protein